MPRLVRLLVVQVRVAHLFEQSERGDANTIGLDAHEGVVVLAADFVEPLGEVHRVCDIPEARHLRPLPVVDLEDVERGVVSRGVARWVGPDDVDSPWLGCSYSM
jgi:hypothetical protein